MKRKRDLISELNITVYTDRSRSTLDINVEKIKNMVNDSIDSAYSERKINVMKSKKKFALIAAAATLVLGITVFAASGIITSWYSSSSSIPEYTSLPSAQQCIKDFGYAPVLIDTFENGYAFESGSVVNNVLSDGNNDSVEEFKSVSFRYEKDGDRVNFSQDKFNSTVEIQGDVIASVGDVDIYYYSYTNKVVPGDYELTEEDKAAEASGELIFSYGSSEVEIIEVQSASWEEDGMRYSLMQLDGNLSAEDLAGMAKEIIAE